MKKYRVKPGSKLNLSKFDPDDSGSFKSSAKGKLLSKKVLQEKIQTIRLLQERMYAEGKRSLLLVLQGMDTAGKDGTIKNVMFGVNPQACRVASFKAPTAEELAHDFLWRVHQEVPPKGHIGIFNRSHYEDVLITRVHKWISEKTAKRRYNQINEFEELLHESGTAIIKIFLHISKEEQKERLLERIKNPEKRWKFNEGDLEERKMWGDYTKVFEDVISATSKKHAPWFIVPANRKWFRNLLVADIVVDALKDMKLQTPPAPQGIDFKNIRIE